MMKPITEEQRQELLEWIPEHIDHLKSVGVLSSYAKNCIVSLEIALASLTAEALVATEKHEISNMQATGMYIRAWPVSRRLNVVEGYTIRLYTAPPVPVINEDSRRIIAGLRDINLNLAREAYSAKLILEEAENSKKEIYQIRNDFNGCVAWVDVTLDSAKEEMSLGGECRVLYSNPPVPEIKVPDEHEGTEHTEYHAGKQEGWNDCLLEIKHLNGLEE